MLQPAAPVLAVLAIGQSNMEGRFGPPDPAMIQPHDKVRVWHLYSRKWMPARLGWRPFRQTSEGPANNLAYVFCRKLAEERRAIVRLVLLVSGGKRIEYFLPSKTLEREGWQNEQTCETHGHSLAPSLFDREGDALSALRSIKRSAFDIVLIHQGEANFSNGGVRDTMEAYRWKLANLIDAMREVSIIGEHTRVIMGKISRHYPGAQDHAIALQQNLGPNTAIVEWEGVEQNRDISEANDLHASGAGLQTLGERYFAAYEQMAGAIWRPVAVRAWRKLRRTLAAASGREASP